MTHRLQVAFWAVICFLFLALATSMLPARAGLDGGIIENWSIGRVVASAILVGLCGFWVPDNRTVVTVYASGILFTLVGPSLVLFSSGGLPVAFPAVVIVSFIIVLAASRTPIRLPNGVASPEVVFWMLLVISIAYVASVMWISGLRYLNFDLTKVYEFRTNADGALPRSFGYLTPSVTGVTIPAAVAIALHLRKWWAVALLVALSILAMGLTGHKFVAVAPFIVIAVFCIVRSPRPVILMASLLLAGLAVSSLDSVLFLMRKDIFGFESGWIASIGVRRALLVPSLLNWYHIDLFSKLDKFYLWSTSRITFGLIESPFDVQAPYLVGKEYFGKPGMSANTGFIGSGFAQAGYLGVMLYSAAIGFTLALVRSASESRSAPLVAAIVAVPLLKAIMSTDFLTALLTHGLAVSLLLVIVLRADNQLNIRSV